VEHILDVVPHVKQGTLIAYTNVPPSTDPFGDTMWFDMAVRLSYPREVVTGEYFLQGGKAAPNQTLTLRNGVWRATGRGFTPLMQSAPLRDTIFVRYGAKGATVLRHVPRFLAAAAAGAAYSPESQIDGSVPDARAVRRYGFHLERTR
jgi:hypothetical protein